VSVLDNPTVREGLRLAWAESQPGTSGAHEEGGFILRNKEGSIFVERWPRGKQNEILVPAHPGGMRGPAVILATFHTHPNLGPPFLQEPSLTDIRAVRADPDLNHAEFEGEYVIASEELHIIRKSGQVEIIGETKILLGII
jgi:hypothetical protein